MHNHTGRACVCVCASRRGEHLEPDGGPTYCFHTCSTRGPTSSFALRTDGENLPMITIHSTDNVIRGKTGSFVLDMRPALDTSLHSCSVEGM